MSIKLAAAQRAAPAIILFGSDSGIHLLDIEDYPVVRQTGAAAVETIRQEGIVMKGQRAAQGKNARRLSGAIIAKRYFDLQRLRDEVCEAEMSCGLQRAPFKDDYAVRAAFELRTAKTTGR